MSLVTWRRFGASVAAIAVAASLTTVSTSAQAATPQALSDGATWLTSQLTNGIVHNDQFQFDDYGLSADIAFALAASDDATGAKAIADAIEPDAAANWYAAFGSTSSGSVAKAAVLAQTTGDDPTNYGGADLIALLESLVSTDAPVTGRIHDVGGTDYANVIGQTYAVGALEQAGSAKAPGALAFLLKQQCSAGYFRLNFTKDTTATDQTCNGGRASGASPADPDVTSTAILQLRKTADTDATAARALGKAEAWLLGQQHADGSFSGGTSTGSPNANSTGLAGWALGELGDLDAARDAAVWIRQHQAQSLAACSTKVDGDTGAIAYDDTALALGQKSGIDESAQDQWRRASSQSVPVLRWLPTTSSTPTLSVPGGYVQAEKNLAVRVGGITPGGAVCAKLGTRNVIGAVGANNTATLAIAPPAGTAIRTIAVTDGTTTRTATVKVLGKKKFKVKATKKVKRGKKATVKVSGLAPHEKFTLRLGKKVAKHGTARANGTVKVRVKVGKKLHKVKVKVTGQFGKIRKGTRTVKVVR